MSLTAQDAQLLITGGLIIDPVQRTQRIADILIRDGKIVAIDENIPAQAKLRGKVPTIDATGLVAGRRRTRRAR